MPDNIRCPEGHTKVWKKGVVPTRQGPKARYICFACGRSFYAPARPVEKPVKAKPARKPKAKKAS